MISAFRKRQLRCNSARPAILKRLQRSERLGPLLAVISGNTSANSFLLAAVDSTLGSANEFTAGSRAASDKGFSGGVSSPYRRNKIWVHQLRRGQLGVTGFTLGFVSPTVIDLNVAFF